MRAVTLRLLLLRYGAADSGVDQWIALESIIKHIRYHLGRYGNNIIA
jgi:hypothetical protein